MIVYVVTRYHPILKEKEIAGVYSSIDEVVKAVDEGNDASFYLYNYESWEVK